MLECPNRLIQLLSRGERKRLLDVCEPFEMAVSSAIGEPNDVARHVHFPTEGFVSLVMQVDRHPGLEVGMVGCEGMLGAEALLGSQITPWRCVVQGAGQSLRVLTPVFRRALQASPALHHVVGCYLAFRVEQLALAAACERFHAIGPRLARWLLMSQDRAHNDSFHCTHEFLGFMLGVRREGVTVAASEFQRQGLIEYRRGELTVLDRAALLASACSCYEANQRVYDRLMH